MGCRAACQGEYRHPSEGKKVVTPGLPVAPARIASTHEAGFAVSVFVEELPSRAPSEPCCRLVRSDSSQVFAAGAVHASVTTLLHSVRLWGQTGVISNCKEVYVAHRESGVKLSKV